MNWLTIREVCEETQLSDATVRRYIRFHSRFIKTDKEGNMIVVSPDSIETLLKIRHYYDKGWTKEKVDKVLEATEAMTIVVHDGQQNVQLGEYLSELKKVIAEMARTQAEQMELNRRLEQEIKELRDELQRRDNVQVNTLESIGNQLSRVEKYARHKRFSLRDLLFGRDGD